MLENGGNEYTNWPLTGMQSILEKTPCYSWDKEDAAQSGQSRQECQSFMEVEGIQRVVHDHIRVHLQCRGAACKRKVTISNQATAKRQYADLPADIAQASFSPYILELCLFLLASGSSDSTTHRMSKLCSLPVMSTSRYYAHQHVVWHFVRQMFEAEMDVQRPRQEAAAALWPKGERRLVLSADGS